MHPATGPAAHAMTRILPGGDSTAVLRWWIDTPADGPLNMAADEWLAAETLRTGLPIGRFSRWRTATLSLGAFQSAASVPAGELQRLPVVRRPSGGGAILHGTDVTCSVAVPRRHPWGTTPERLYDAVHEALVRVLRGLTLRAGIHRPADRVGSDAAAPFLCFDRRSGGDVVIFDSSPRPPKILGSAQRRHRAAVVQHGSLLWSRNPAAADDHGHAGVSEEAAAVGVVVDQNTVCDAWLAAIATTAGLRPSLQSGCTWDVDPAAIGPLVARFQDPAWTARR